MAKQIKVVVGPKEGGLCLVFGDRIRFEFGQIQQCVGPADADVSSAIEGVGHHIGVGVGEVVILLPAGLVVVGRVTSGVGIVGTDLTVHDGRHPLAVGHGPSHGVINSDQGRGHLLLGLVIVAGEELVHGFHLEDVLIACGQNEGQTGKNGQFAIHVVHRFVR